MKPTMLPGRRSPFWMPSALCAVVIFCSGFLFTLFAEASPSPPLTTDIPHPSPWPESFASLYLPLVQAAEPATPTPIPPQATEPVTSTPIPPAEREWDERLDPRGAMLTAATVASGQGYWRLVRGVWYDEQEAGGRHHILVDVIDEEGTRMVGVPVRFYWSDGQHIVHTQAKPGEEYAADYAMFDVAPSYGAVPASGDPADTVWGMGLGSLERPYHTIHSSYGLVWQWTIMLEQPPATATPTPSSTLTATSTPTPVETAPTPSATPTPSPTVEAIYLFKRAHLVRCDPNAGITYVQGTLRLAGQPVNGYRVVFSYAPDGPIVAGITAGPHPGYEGWDPGYYSHILQAGGPREGDWWFWVVDEQNQRISQMGYVHTDGIAGEGHCQQAVIDFDSS